MPDFLKDVVKSNRYFIACLFLFLLLGCSSNDKQMEDVVAQVNMAQVRASELKSALPPQITPEIEAALKRQLMEKWIEDEIFYQAALQEGLTLSENELFLLKNYEKRMLIKKFLDKNVNLNYRVLDQEIEDYYTRQKSEFVWDADYVHIIHLILESEDKAINTEISKSKNLLEVITANFFDQQSTEERPIGDLGYVKQDDLPEQLARRIKTMRTGTIRGPIKTDFGYHFVQLLDKQKKGAVKDLDIVKEEIVLRLKIQKRMAEIDNLKQKLRPNYTVQTDLSKLNQP